MPNAKPSNSPQYSTFTAAQTNKIQQLRLVFVALNKLINILPNTVRLIRTLQYSHTNPLNFEQSPLSGLPVTVSEVLSERIAKCISKLRHFYLASGQIDKMQVYFFHLQYRNKRMQFTRATSRGFYCFRSILC